MFKRQNVLVMLCLLLVVAMLGTTFVSAAETTSHWSQEYITWAYGKGLTYSESNAGYRPEDSVTNAEFYKMVNRLAGYTEKAPISYRDVYYNNWYYDDVAIAVKAGYLRDSKEALNPNAFITRDEAARIIAYVYGLSPQFSSVNMFSDGGLISNKGEVGALVAKAVINGYPDGTFKPQNSIKRGEVAKILYYSYSILGNSKTYSEKPVYPYYKSCKYYGATAAEYEALRVAIVKGKAKLAEGPNIGTAAQIAELRSAVENGESIYNNAKYYDGYYYPYGYGYNYGYEYGRFASREGIRDALVASGFSNDLANAIAYNSEFVSYDGSGYYLNANFYSSYGYNGYPYYERAYYGSFDAFYNDYKAYFGYDRDLAYKAWTNGYYGYGCYEGYWYGYGSDAVRAATKRIYDAIDALTPVTPPVTPAEKVTITFDKNGGTGTMAPVEVKKGSDYTLPACTFTAPTNQEFKAWEVAGAEKAVGDKITADANKTVKALWKDKAVVEDKVTITFDANGGTETMAPVEVVKGSNYTLPDCGFTAPNENQEFKAWLVGSEEKQPGASITVNANTEIKAVWKDKAVVEKVTVTLVADNGTGTTETEQVEKGKEYTLPAADKFTAPADKEFKAWLVGSEEKQPGVSITVDADTEVKAVWKEKAKEFNIKVEGIGASGDKTSAKAGDTVKLKLTFEFASDGTLESCEVKDSSGTSIGCTIDDSTKTVTFIMPESDVTVTPSVRTQNM